MLLRVPTLTSLITILLVMTATMGHAQTTNTVAFQGRVTAPGGGAPADGVYRMSFTLLNAETLGDTLWTETDFNVPVAGGLFTYQLGSTTPFPEGLFSDELNLFLEIAIDVNNNGIDSGDIQSPRTPLNAVPVAMHAKDAAMLGGLEAQQYPTITAVTAELIALETTLDNTLANSQAAQDAVIAEKADLDDLEEKLARRGAAYVVVDVGDDPEVNGTNLLQAYQELKTLTPHGAFLSATNRVVLALPPGRYHLGTAALTLDTQYVDIVGLTTNREAQRITGASNGAGTGVLRQTADDVRIENLFVECTGGSGGFTSSTPAAYFPDSNLPNTVVKNCRFEGVETDGNSAFSWGTRLNITYAGHYEDIAGSFRLFNGGVLSGTFINCTGDTFSFGSGGTASGTFINCTATNESFARSGTASGTFINCKAGNNSFGAFGTASGTFRDCQSGTTSFGGGTSGSEGTASGTFINCIGDSNSFGGGIGGVSLGAVLIGCQMTGGSYNPTFRGRMENCRWVLGSTSLFLGAEARIYGSTFTGANGVVNLNNAAAGVTQSRAKGFSNAGNNIFGATNAAAFNIASAEVQ